MKVISSIIISAILITGCSSGESEEEAQDVVFGELTGEQKIQARNVFDIGETVHFIYRKEASLEVEEVDVALSTLNPDTDEWIMVTESPMPVNPESNEVVNGLDGSLFEDIGDGVYQLELKFDEESASGQFVIQSGDGEE